MEVKTELQRNAIVLARRKELETYQRAQDIQWLNSRMEDGRMGRCLALIQREAEMEKEFHERTDHAAIVNECAAKETALGLEIAKVRREEACKLLRRHYLREQDPSLRDLTRQLQAGYVCRDLQLQIKNNEYKRLQDKAEEKQANAVLHNALYNNQEAQEAEERDKLERMATYRRELQQQLVNREQQRRCSYEDTLIEKKLLEDIMRTLADEDQRELAQKREVMSRLQNEMATSQAARAAWKEKQKQLLVLEEREIERQNANAADRSSALVAAREQKLREREALNEAIAAKILADEAERKEREDIIKLLQEQEYIEKNVNNDISEREKAERVKKETKQALTAQMESRRKSTEEQRKRDAEFRREAEAKMTLENQEEREKQMRKKQQERQYAQELLRQIQENAAKKEKEKVMEEARAQNVWGSHEAWSEDVMKERREIVREHAPHLLGYLQAGVLKVADLPVVREGANQHPELAGLDIEAMAISKRPHRFSKCNPQCRVLRDF